MSDDIRRGGSNKSQICHGSFRRIVSAIQPILIHRFVQFVVLFCVFLIKLRLNIVTVGFGRFKRDRERERELVASRILHLTIVSGPFPGETLYMYRGK